MTTKINGTNTAASPAITGSDTDTGLSFGTDTVNINTGGTTRTTIESNGRLGIGTTSPACDLHVSGANPRTRFTSTGNTVNYDIFMGSSNPTIGTSSNHALAFMINDSEVARFRTPTGGLMIGETGGTRIGEPKLHVLSGGSGNNVASFFYNTTHDRDAIIIRHNGADGGNNRIMIGLANADGNKVGNIISNGSSTSYNTSSDYRLKENVTAISDGITRLKTLKPYKFNFKADASTTVDGFFAHEVTAVPEAISGEKDAVDSDDNPVYQGIDQSKLVPLLTAALQEAVAKIEVLETKVAALEGG